MVDTKIFKLAQEHLKRLDSAKFPSSKYTPFFNSIKIYNQAEQVILETMNGKTLDLEYTPSKSPLIANLEMRMGSSIQGGSQGVGKMVLSQDLESSEWQKNLNRISDSLFWACAKGLEKMDSAILGKKAKRSDYIYFANENPSVYREKDKIFNLDIEKLETELKDVSNKLQRPWLRDIKFSFVGSKEEDYFISSEGSNIFQNRIFYQLLMEVSAVDKKNLVIPNVYSICGNDFSQLPTSEELMKRGNILINELEKILEAPQQKNGEFPTILDAENTGVLIHEVVGHGLEGHRIYSGEDLFKDQIGEMLAPSFLSLYDDPALSSFHDLPLNGHYLFDDEGVRGQKVSLIKDGRLQNYLHSRSSAGYFKTNSNGHCRMQILEMPCVRQGNLILKSSNTVPFNELKKSLIKECVKHGKEYGLILQGTSGGLVLPEESFYNTYPANVFRVYQNGKVQRVRGIYQVGTPYQTLSNIIQTGDKYKAFNGFCGAESGWIPTSQIAPATLTKSSEFSQIPEDQYILAYDSIFQKK